MRRLLLPLALVASLLLAACGTSQAETASSPAARAPRGTPPTIFTSNTKKNRFAPRIVGSPTVGQLLTTTNGTWTNSPTTFAYQWQRCTSPGTCSNIAAATAGSYTVQLADVGDTIRVIVTATGAGGPLSQTSAETGVVVTGAPAGGTVAVTGTATQGQTLTATTSAWSGSPTTYDYQWQDCDPSGLNCANVASGGSTSGSGSATNNYTLAAADVGSTLRAQVTAHNGTGASTAVAGAASPNLDVLSTSGHYLYVSPSGSDSANNCQTIGSPCRTLTRAFSQMSAGYTIYARAGNYGSTDNQVTWSVSGTSSAPVTLSAYPGETPVFDGGSTGCSPTTNCNGDGFGYFLLPTGDWQVINGLKMQHWASTAGGCSTGCTGVIQPNSNTIAHETIENNYFLQNGGGQNDHDIYPGHGSVGATITYLTIRGNTFDTVGGGGIQFYSTTNALTEVTHCFIYNNLFINNFWGIAASGGTDVQILGNTFYHTRNEATYGPSAAAITTNAGTFNSGLDVENNIAYTTGNNTLGFVIISGQAATLTEGHNTWFGQGITGGSPGTGDLSSNPLFTSAPSDLTLQGASPAIDAGTTLSGGPTNDILDVPRPQGAAFDMGAYER